MLPNEGLPLASLASITMHVQGVALSLRSVSQQCQWSLCFTLSGCVSGMMLMEIFRRPSFLSYDIHRHDRAIIVRRSGVILLNLVAMLQMFIGVWISIWLMSLDRRLGGGFGDRCRCKNAIALSDDWIMMLKSRWSPRSIRYRSFSLLIKSRVLDVLLIPSGTRKLVAVKTHVAYVVFENNSKDTKSSLDW